MGKLYIVATPIGNIEDITLRAIRILKEVDFILCENVSESHRLLKHYEVKTSTTNYYSNSKLDKIDKIINMLEDGKNLALISDAGTPCVSDPGSLLVNKIYEHIKNNNYLNKGKTDKVEIVTIPGPSAITALYSISGVTGNSFSFYGFIPQKKGRQTFIKNTLIKSKEDDIPIIFYESVHRFEKLLLEIEKSISINNYELIIGRELTKVYEEIIRGSILEVKEYFENNKEKVRGEFVIMIHYLNKQK